MHAMFNYDAIFLTRSSYDDCLPLQFRTRDRRNAGERGARFDADMLMACPPMTIEFATQQACRAHAIAFTRDLFEGPAIASR